MKNNKNDNKPVQILDSALTTHETGPDMRFFNSSESPSVTNEDDVKQQQQIFDGMKPSYSAVNLPATQNQEHDTNPQPHRRTMSLNMALVNDPNYASPDKKTKNQVLA